MRFDDRLATALRSESPEGWSAIAQWRQIVDLIAQAPADFDHALVAQALVRAHRLSDAVPLAIRIAAVRALAGRLSLPPLVAYLAHDEPAVAAEAIAGAELSDGQWTELAAHLPVRARGFLRLRSDLGPLTRAALDRHAGGDFVLSDERPAEERQATPQPAEVAGPVAIRDLVERIERFRLAREEEPRAAPPIDTTPVLRFLFETDEHGTVVWGEGAPPGAIVGIGIAEPALDDGPGPDAHAAAAFRQRMPIAGARMRLLGSARLEGDWRIEAEPFFDPRDGRFQGYRGIMRRPGPTEDARIGGEERQSDQLRQLVHELRTPLNAIIGFAEIIEQQLFGPASDDYRTLAGSILEDARRLLAGIDDLDIAARLDSGRWAADDGSTDPAWLTGRLVERLRSLADERQVTLNLVAVEPMRAFAVPGESCERMFARLISAVLLACEPGETLSGTFRTRIGARPQNRFLLTHPARFSVAGEQGAFHGEVDLPDRGAGEGADTAMPLLGVGFSLRLVRSLARNAGGELYWTEEGLLLTLPAAADSQASNQR